MGAIFAAMKLNSSPRGVHYKERANAQPHCSPGQEGFQGPRGMEWFGGVERRGTCEKGAEGAAGGEEEGGVWGVGGLLTGGKGRKDTVNI